MKQPQDDRNPWLRRLNPLRRTPQAEPARPPASYRAPSRANRKAVTTWQDEAAVKQLKHIAAELGVSQQALIAEGINHVLAKYGKPTVAT
jgi:hypothetical protein